MFKHDTHLSFQLYAWMIHRLLLRGLTNKLKHSSENDQVRYKDWTKNGKAANVKRDFLILLESMENFLLKSTWPFEMIANASSLEENIKDTRIAQDFSKVLYILKINTVWVQFESIKSVDVSTYHTGDKQSPLSQPSLRIHISPQTFDLKSKNVCFFLNLSHTCISRSLC